MVMGQLKTKVDVAIIGGGPGGYTAAIRAAQLGLEVALIERNRLGGVCTNAGCIPSKALLHAAETLYGAVGKDAAQMGIYTDVRVDFAKMQRWKDGVVSGLRDGIASLCRMNGVDVIEGSAFFSGPGTITVETEAGLREIEYKKAVIATGTKPKGLPNLPLDGARIVDSDGIFALKQVPKRLLIVGGGYIAAEMANLFLKLGSKVTVVHRGDRMLKSMDADCAALLPQRIKELGGEVLFRSEIAGTEGYVAVASTPGGEKRIEFDCLLVAGGRVPDLDGLKLEKTKVLLTEDGCVAVDAACRTADANIYAVGDVTPGPQLAHKAFRQGKVAAEAIAGLKSGYDNAGVPMVVFSDPEIASIGPSEEEARAKAGPGDGIKIGKMPLSASGRAKTLNNASGFVKIVADANGIILGVHISGPEAGVMIAEAGLALEMAATLEDLAATMHAHPTMPEALGEAAEDALGKAVHLYRGKKK